jgi:hypothetical protein
MVSGYGLRPPPAVNARVLVRDPAPCDLWVMSSSRQVVQARVSQVLGGFSVRQSERLVLLTHVGEIGKTVVYQEILG